MQQRYVINNNLLNKLDVQSIINCTKTYTKPQLLHYLKYNFKDSYLLVAEQVELFEKTKIKLPLWHKKGCLVTRKALEQCSSQGLSIFKSKLVKGNEIVDLSGGLGVDDVVFSKRFKSVISVDCDEELNNIVRYNVKKLLINNITRIDAKAEDYIKTLTHPVDAFYIDADRRPTLASKVFRLENSIPNVLDLMPLMLKKSKLVMLKLSPMMDLKLLRNTFNTISNIYVVGLKNEVKEILVMLDKNIQPNPLIHAVEVDVGGNVIHDFLPDKVVEKSIIKNNDEMYFYEPSNMLIKAGLSADYALATNCSLISKNSHYALSKNLIKNYFGRFFSVIHHSGFSKSIFKKYLHQADITKANVSARNFVTTVDEIRRTFKIEDGGEEYLFFTQDAAKNKLFWHCRRV